MDGYKLEEHGTWYNKTGRDKIRKTICGYD